MLIPNDKSTSLTSNQFKESLVQHVDPASFVHILNHIHNTMGDTKDFWGDCDYAL